MATSASASALAQMTVFIVPEHREFTRSYELSPETTLSELLAIWMGECDLHQNWVFLSIDKKVRYENNWTLENVRESNPGTMVIRIRAEISREVDELLINANGECHLVGVRPKQKLYEVLWRCQNTVMASECNGLPLQMKETASQAGLMNKAVIHERMRHVTVKLSSGATRVFRILADGLVHQLMEMLETFENGQFYLLYQGRPLHPQERIRKIDKVVQVAKGEYIEIMNALRGMEDTKNGRLDEHAVTALRSCYVQSTQKCSCNHEFNVLRDNKDRSSSKKNQLEKMQFLQSFFEDTLQRSNVQTKASRDVSRNLKELLTEKGLDYDEFKQLFKIIQKRIINMESKAKEEVKRMATKNERTEEELRSLKTKNERTEEELRSLKTKNERTEEELRSLKTKNEKTQEELQGLKTKNERTEEELRSLKTKNERTQEELRSLKTKNERTQEELRSLKTKNERTEEELRSLKTKNENLKENTEHLQKVVKCFHEETGVKLLVFHHRNAFTPVASRPELGQQGRYSWEHADDRYFKCIIPDLRAGLRTFEEVREVLRPLVTGSQIVEIRQLRGFASGTEFAMVTSRGDDEVKEYFKDVEFCDVEGRQVTWGDIGQLEEPQKIYEGGRVVISGGRRRTVLVINPCR